MKADILIPEKNVKRGEADDDERSRGEEDGECLAHLGMFAGSKFRPAGWKRCTDDMLRGYCFCKCENCLYYFVMDWPSPEPTIRLLSYESWHKMYSYVNPATIYWLPLSTPSSQAPRRQLRISGHRSTLIEAANHSDGTGVYGSSSNVTASCIPFDWKNDTGGKDSGAVADTCRRHAGLALPSWANTRCTKQSRRKLSCIGRD